MNKKILVLGVDGMDPRLTKKFVNAGKMPNVKKFIERGACREDLVLLGAVPTITPPLWTTLATGTYPGTHGITCFWNQHPAKIDTLVYSFDSRNCHAEQLWNVFAEAGKKTLVFHWPGSAWPPSSDSPNLHVVDGTQPSNINIAVAVKDWEQLIFANTKTDHIEMAERENDDSGAGCIVTDIGDLDKIDDVKVGKKSDNSLDTSLNAKEISHLLMSEHEGECSGHDKPLRMTESPIKPAKGWTNAPADAKEFIVPLCNGLVRRPCLILKNENGQYDRVAIYKSKKDAEPIVVLKNNDFAETLLDEALLSDGSKIDVVRSYFAYDIASDGTSAKVWFGSAMDFNNDSLFHPKELLKKINENVGYVPSVAISLNGSKDPEAQMINHTSWEHYTAWQSRAMHYLIDTEGYEVVFSHIHNVDCLGHYHWESAYMPENPELGKVFEGFMERAYVDTDKYLGSFMPYLDQGWNIFIVSDHGLVCKNKEIPALGDPFGVNVKVMKELGYTVLKKDENGEELREIDWSKTTAVAPRGNHIYLNLKSRDPERGIVSDEERYDLETKIISDLYNYRWKGKDRIVSIALRNKEAALLGLAGPYTGDILYWNEEGFNRIHGDSLSTYYGYADTSVSPIFMAAGEAIKEAYKTTRVIRQVDVAPTIAAIGGVRMPSTCEGAVIYQILAD